MNKKFKEWLEQQRYSWSKIGGKWMFMFIGKKLISEQFKNWIDNNKLPITTGLSHEHAIVSSTSQYSILPMLYTVIYNPRTFEPTYVYRRLTKERYDELVKTRGPVMYGEGINP